MPGASTADSLNAALGVSEGEYVLPLNEGALLRPHALLDLVMTAECVPGAELIYTDEDRIDEAGRRSGWRFKPAWSPDLFEASDYIGQLTLMRRETVRDPRRLARRRGAIRSTTCFVGSAVRSSHARIVHLAKLLVHGTGGQADTRALAKRQASEHQRLVPASR